jgi:LysM repeat protein
VQNFKVSYQSILEMNPGINADCTNLTVNQVIKIPYPTPTELPRATATLEAADATQAACETVILTVQENDTLSSIALNYAVPMQAIKDWNGLSTDSVFFGTQLKIPLCARAATPGPTPTATLPPPYAAANLLLPADGAAFTLAHDVVTLQWASIGALRENEAYQVIVEDVTAGQARRIVDFATDTKFIVPTSFRPNDNLAHVLRWWITPMRQTGSDAQGQPVWTAAGAPSDKRDFTWVGAAVPTTPTP